MRTGGWSRRVAPDEDAVFVKSGRCGVLRNSDLGKIRIFGLEKTFTLAVHPNLAGDEFGIVGLLLMRPFGV
jgi:hypothetical protein